MSWFTDVSLINELPQLMLSNVFSFMFGLAANTIIKRTANTCKKFKIKRVIKKNFKNKIFTIDNANPYYNSRNINFRVTDHKFYLSIPSEELREIKHIFSDFNAQNETIFCYKNINELGKHIKLVDDICIKNFGEIVERHKKIVAKEFLSKAQNGVMIYNNKKLGIKKISVTRARNDEENELVIDLYETDYYTHRVMRSVYKDITNSYRMDTVNYIDGLNKLYCFLTSFGINSILRITDKRDKYIMLVKRSKHMANMKGEQWHVTMNEGLNLKDVTDKTIDPNNWARRGFTEELGIGDYITRNMFCALFLNKEDFEIGITSIADTTMSKKLCIEALKTSKDGLIENVDVDFIVDNYRSIMKFLNRHKDITSACRYSLMNYVSKMMLSNNEL